MSYFACCHWQAGQAQAGGFAACLALPCPAWPAPSVPWYLPKVNPPTHPSVPMAPPPTHGPVPTLTLPGHGRQGHLVLRLGAWLGFPKISRACLLLCFLNLARLSSSPPLPLLYSHPPPRTRHDKSQQSLVRKAVFFISDHLADPKPFIPLTSSPTDGGALHPTVSAKKHSRRPRLDRIPIKTQSKTNQPTTTTLVRPSPRDPDRHSSQPASQQQHTTSLSILGCDLHHSVDTRPCRHPKRCQ